MTWEHAQAVEKNWWGDCRFAYQEEIKQETYAHFMGLRKVYFQGKMGYDCNGLSVLDIGGGPASMLIKAVGLKKGKVIDPIGFPNWVETRYHDLGIEHEQIPGEDVDDCGWDEVWIYNCLQHTKSPETVIRNAMRSAKVLRIFEWVNMPVEAEHPHSLTREMLDGVIGCSGGVTYLEAKNHPGCQGMAYHAVSLL